MEKLENITAGKVFKIKEFTHDHVVAIVEVNNIKMAISLQCTTKNYIPPVDSLVILSDFNSVLQYLANKDSEVTRFNITEVDLDNWHYLFTLSDEDYGKVVELVKEKISQMKEGK